MPMINLTYLDKIGNLRISVLLMNGFTEDITKSLIPKVNHGRTLSRSGNQRIMTLRKVKEIAELVDVCTRTVGKWIHRDNNPLPYIKVWEWYKKYSVVEKKQIERLVTIK